LAEIRASEARKLEPGTFESKELKAGALKPELCQSRMAGFLVSGPIVTRFATAWAVIETIFTEANVDLALTKAAVLFALAALLA
jgi:hypothetical protein